MGNASDNDTQARAVPPCTDARARVLSELDGVWHLPTTLSAGVSFWHAMWSYARNSQAYLWWPFCMRDEHGGKMAAYEASTLEELVVLAKIARQDANIKPSLDFAVLVAALYLKLYEATQREVDYAVSQLAGEL